MQFSIRLNVHILYLGNGLESQSGSVCGGGDKERREGVGGVTREGEVTLSKGSH